MRERARARVFATAAVVVAVAACVAWFAGRDSAGNAAQGGEAAAPGAGLAAVELAADDRPAERGEATRAPLAPPTVDAAAVEPASAADEGVRVVVLDAAGREHTEERGWLTIQEPRGSSRYSSKAAVREGRFEPPAGAFHVERGVFGGRSALPVGRTPSFGDDLEPAVVVLAWTPDILLRVVAADTGEDLNGVEYRLSESMLYSGVREPGGVPGATSRTGDSPIAVGADALPDATGSLRVDARAPGYAWGAAFVDLRRAGERRLELLPAGELDVEVAGELPRRGAFVRVRAQGEGGRVLSDTVVGGPLRVRIPNLPLGPVAVELCLGGAGSGSAVVRDRAAAVVRRGVAEHVSLEIGAVDSPERVPLAGTLVHPAAWGEVPDRLQVYPLELGSGGGRGGSFPILRGPVDGPDDTYAWSAGDVEPGRHAIWLRHGTLATLAYFEVEVAPPGRTDLEIVVPLPADVVVRTLDAATGEPVRFETLTLRWPTPGAPGFSLVDGAFPWDAELEGFRARVPAGRVEVFPNVTQDGALFLPPAVLELEPGASEHTLEVVRPLTLEIELRDDGLPVPFGPWECAVRAVDHAGAAPHPGLVGGVATAYVDRPGRYAVAFPELPGYRPVPEREVVVREGETARVVVDLERVR